MAVLNSITSIISAVSQAITPNVTAPGSMWHLLILKTFAFISDYGWRIVVFTLLLKLVLSPFDFFQRYKMNKNQKITERLKPTMDKIQKQYGDDKQAFAQKQMELNRKEGYSYFSACLPMIVTMVVFITLWISMQTIARYMTFKEYTAMYDEFQYVYSQVKTDTDADTELTDAERAARLTAAEDIGRDVVYQMYYYGLDDGYITELKKTEAYAAALPDGFTLLRDGKKIEKVQASFLWIKNIWAPDVPWGDQAILSWDKFKTGVGDYGKATTSGLTTEQQGEVFSNAAYQRVMGKLLKDKTQSRTNGYLILPLLVVLLSLASQLISVRQQKRAGQVNNKGGMATSMKVMMIIMPIMMAAFALQYASIFSLYMAVNSATTLMLNLLFTGILKLADMRKRGKTYGIRTGSTRYNVNAENSPIIHYVKGANPHAGERTAVAVQQAKPKKQKTDAAAPVRRSGRPDPNELLNNPPPPRKK